MVPFVWGVVGLFHICVQNSFLLEVVRHGVLGEKRRLEADFGADPFAFGMGCVGRVVTAAATAELRAEIGRLDLVKWMDFFPGCVAHRAGDIDF